MQATVTTGTDDRVREAATTFHARDGRRLAGTTFTGPDVRAALVVNGGTGIPRGFYARFARHAASRGFATLTYDYRGMGDSRVGHLRDEPAAMHDWGRFDMAGALDHHADAFPGVPVFVLGHSVGGQLVGLMENHDRASAYAFVAVSTGVFWRMPPAYAAYTAALWYGVFPLTGALFGYVPGTKRGLGEDLPRGVAREWGDWCTSRDYFGTALVRDGLRPLHAEVTRPIDALSFTDDPIASARNVTDLLAFYRRAPLTHERLAPADAGLRGIGHLGFFRESGRTLWDRPLDRLRAHAGLR